MTLFLKAIALAALIALALLGTCARPAAAASSTPCWKTLLNDWYDGRIDGTYAIHCYKDALKHLPKDVDTYSSARDDIERALQSARLTARKSGAKLTPNTILRPARSKAPTRTRKGTGTGTGKGTGTVTAPVAAGRRADKGLGSVADKLNPGSPTALPIPLLVLGGLALLLVAAGGTGLVLKRLQGRRPGA